MRKIIIYSTKGQNGSFESDAKTWGEITNQVENIVGSLDNLIATENINKTNLGHEDSVLPTGDFKIFLRPSKTKSGVDFKSMSFKELRAFITKEGQTCKDILNTEAKKTRRNWTQLGTSEIASILSKEYSTTSSDKPAKQSTSSSSKKEVASKKIETKKVEEKEVSREDLDKEFVQLKRGFM